MKYVRCEYKPEAGSLSSYWHIYAANKMPEGTGYFKGDTIMVIPGLNTKDMKLAIYEICYAIDRAIDRAMAEEQTS